MGGVSLLRAISGAWFAPRFRVVRLMLAVLLTVMLLTRLVLLLMHGALTTNGPAAILAAVARGELFDLLAALWLLAPLTLYLTLLPARWFHGRRHGTLLRASVVIAFYALLFVALAEGFFFDEFDGRFNFAAVDYLIFPTEVTVNLWESYPLARLLLALLVVTIALAWALRGTLQRLTLGETRWPARAAFLVMHAALLLVLSATVSPSLARVSDDRALNEIAGNGYYTFWQALMGQDAPYEGLYATLPPEAVAARLPGLFVEASLVPGSFVAGSAARRIVAVGPERRLNVVVVLEESLGAEFMGALHPRETSLTPQFDSLAAQGTLLVRAYSTGNRTIRALEATTASLPPLPGISIVRRPASRNLFTLPALLRQRGYHTAFVYGGRALFDGMGSYMRHNGVDQVVEQKDFPEGAFRTAWGVADEVIFDGALRTMDSLAATGAPFYALILSVSNHKPFQFPTDEIQPLPGLRGRENAVRYADHALGRFMREARRHAFFDNTLFVLMGDHGPRVYGAAEIPLHSYEVPIVFLAPKWVPAGRRVTTLASTLDVPPTVLALLGMSYTSKFFGRDVLGLEAHQGQAMMTHNNQVALMRGSSLAVLGLHESAMIYRHDSASGAMRPAAVPTPRERDLLADAIAAFSGADRFYRTGTQGLDPLATRRPPP